MEKMFDIQLDAMNASESAFAYSGVEEPEGPISGQMSESLLRKIASARRFILNEKAGVLKVCLRDEGFLRDDLEACLGDFREGYSEIKVFGGGSAYLFLESRHDCDNWVELEIFGVFEHIEKEGF